MVELPDVHIQMILNKTFFTARGNNSPEYVYVYYAAV